MYSHAMMMSSQNAVQQPCPYKGPANLNWVDKQLVGCRIGGHRTGQLGEQKDIPSGREAIGTRQEATLEAKDYLIKEVNNVDVGTEATAFVSTTPLLEGEPNVHHPTPCTTAQPVPPHLVPSSNLYLYNCSTHKGKELKYFIWAAIVNKIPTIFTVNLTNFGHDQM